MEEKRQIQMYSCLCKITSKSCGRCGKLNCYSNKGVINSDCFDNLPFLYQHSWCACKTHSNDKNADISINYKRCISKKCKYAAMITSKYCFNHTNNYRKLNGREPFHENFRLIPNLMKHVSVPLFLNSMDNFYREVKKARIANHIYPLNLKPYPNKIKHSKKLSKMVNDFEIWNTSFIKKMEFLNFFFQQDILNIVMEY